VLDNQRLIRLAQALFAIPENLPVMLQNYLKIAFRNLWKNANFSLINIFGLSVSLAVCALIGMYLHFETNFDRSNPAHASMYRLLTTFKYPNSPESTWDLSAAMMGPYLHRECGDIEQYLRVMTSNEDFLCKSERRETTLKKVLQADSTFFAFFNFPLLHGDPANAFSMPENMVLARPVAESLYGTENPLGKIIEHTYTLPGGADTTIYYTVSGVFDYLPANSHLQFDALTLLDSRQFERWDEGSRWHGVVAGTYFRLHPSVKDAGKVAATFSEALKKEMPNSEMIALSLQPFADIHAGSSEINSGGNNHLPVNRKYLRILGLIALLILFISSVNFANLSTVLALKRGQEVGVRKSLGASGVAIVRHFLGESMLMALLSGGLALLWAELLRQPFLSLLGRDPDLPIPGAILTGFSGMVVLLGLLAGLYPAMQAARYSALEAFQRNKTVLSVKRPFVQRLVVLQFALSGTLVIGSLICYQQLHFLKNKDLGFRYDQVVEMNLGESNWMRSPAMKKELAALPGVEAVTSSDRSLGAIDSQNGVLVRNDETGKWENFPMSIIRVDYNYFDLYGMRFAAGRAPTPEGAASQLEYVVNEAFLKKVGWTGDPIGRQIMRAGLSEGMAGRVVGVIRDVHHNTLRHAIEPLCMQASEVSSVVSIKMSAADVQPVLKQAAVVWERHIKDRPFQYQFKDAHFAHIYQSESRLGQVLFFATLLSIFIACLGLLALSAFIIGQRTKEIGVRKVLGATTTGLVGLLSKDFLKLVVVSLIIASPVAYFFMEHWLQDFAYRIDIQWTVFVLAGVIAVAVAFLTVSFQSVRAALANPVKSLRSE
jgi:putative ABC transport system permease protein